MRYEQLDLFDTIGILINNMEVNELISKLKNTKTEMILTNKMATECIDTCKKFDNLGHFLKPLKQLVNDQNEVIHRYNELIRKLTICQKDNFKLIIFVDNELGTVVDDITFMKEYVDNEFNELIGKVKFESKYSLI